VPRVRRAKRVAWSCMVASDVVYVVFVVCRKVLLV
jgi:hypothetical protein